MIINNKVAWYILICLGFLILVDCGKKIPPRQEIISRHLNGEKKYVAIYEGEGLDEKVIMQYRYNKNGKIEYIKDSKKNIEEYYIKGRLVKRIKNGNSLLTTNLFELLADDDIRSKVLLGEFYGLWADGKHYNPDSVIALNHILISRGVYSTMLGKDITRDTWYSEIGFPLAAVSLKQAVDNYCLGFGDGIITEFGYNSFSQSNHVKTFKINRLFISNRPGTFTIEFVEIRNHDKNQIVGSNKREKLTIVDPFTIKVGSNTLTRREAYGNVIRKDLLWD